MNLKDPECAERYVEAVNADGEYITVLNYSWQSQPPVSAMALLPQQPSREAVTRLQSVLAPYPQVELEPVHYFAPGMYGRELAIPRDTVVVGKIHRHRHLTLLIKGTATINTDRGMEKITAPHVWVSQEGAKRALYTESDCVFFTCHATNETDFEKLEAELIEPETLQIEGEVP